MSKVEVYKIDPQTKEGDCCPECKANWDGGDVLEHMLEARNNPSDETHAFYKYKSDAELVEAAGHYGWGFDNKVRFGHLIGIELSHDDPDHYDGVSYWQCPECGIAWNRWSGERTEKYRNIMARAEEQQKAFEEESKNNKDGSD